MCAPALFACEITNILYQRVRGQKFTVEKAKEAIQDVFVVGIELDALQKGTISSRALELAARFGQKASYDAHYLALAESKGCEFWTADERIWRAVKDDLPWVRWLGEYAVPPTP